MFKISLFLLFHIYNASVGVWRLKLFKPWDDFSINHKIECLEGFGEKTLRVLFGDYQWNKEYDKNSMCKINSWVTVNEAINVYYLLSIDKTVQKKILSRYK